MDSIYLQNTKQYIKDCFFSLIDSHEKYRELLDEGRTIPYAHCCLEMTLPRKSGKSQTLLELAIQFQKVYLVVRSTEEATQAARLYPEFDCRITSLELMRGDKLAGIDISDNIFILDDISIKEFLGVVKQGNDRFYHDLSQGIAPIFSALTLLK